jgi:hypothetical protein
MGATMINETHRRIARKLFTLGILSVCLFVFSRTDMRGAGGQGTGQKVIEKAFTRSSPVVEVAEIRVSQKAVVPGQAFDGDDDWLSTVFLKAKNVSGKPIVYLAINVNFPETRASGGMMSYPVVFGQMPGSRFPQTHDPLFMLPHDSLEIPLDKHYTKIKSFVERRNPIKNIHKLELEIGFVVFADKTAWMAGDFLRQDPNDPDHYINVGSQPPR